MGVRFGFLGDHLLTSKCVRGKEEGFRFAKATAETVEGYITEKEMLFSRTLPSAYA